MATGSEVAKYYATLGAKVDHSGFRRYDVLLKQMEQRMLKFKKNMESYASLNNFKFDSLKFQKQAQGSINKVQKLLQVELSNFKIDNSRLHTSLQSAINRAVYSTQFKLKPTVDRSSVSQGTRRVYNHSVESGGLSGMFGLAGNLRYAAGLRGLPMLGAVGGVGALAAAPLTGGYAAYNYANETIKPRVITADRNSILLNQTIGGNAENQKYGVQWYRNLTNSLGVDAEAGINDFNTAVTLMKDQGMSTGQSIRNYELFAKRFTLRHLTADQQKGSLRQITQIIGRGTVQAEDLNSLVENGDPQIKGLLRQAWAQRTNYQGDNLSRDYAKAQEKGQVTGQDLLAAYQLSAVKYAKQLEEATNSVRADEQRLKNQQFWQQQELDTNPELVKSTEDLIKSQRELNEAMAPLRQAFLQLEIGAVQLATKFAEGASWLVKSLPDLAGKYGTSTPYGTQIEAPKLNNKQLYGGTGTRPGGWLYNLTGMFSESAQYDLAGATLDPFKLKDPSSRKDYIGKAEDVARQQLMSSSASNTSIKAGDLNIAPGGIQINVESGDAQQIFNQMESQLNDFWKRKNDDQLNDMRLNYTKPGV